MDRESPLRRIASWFQPTSQDENIAQRQRILNLTLGLLGGFGLVLALFSVVLSLLSSSLVLFAIISGTVLFVISVLGLGLSRRSYDSYAALIPPFLIFTIALALNIRFGAGHFVIGLYPLAVIVAVLLSNFWVGAGTALFGLFAHVIIADLHANGQLANRPLASETVSGDFFGLLLSMAVLLGFLYIYQRETRLELSTAQASNRTLRTQAELLQGKVEKKEQELERRIVQIRTVAEITSTIQGVLEKDKLLNQLVNLVKERFGLYYAGVFLLDPRQEYAVLHTGTGEPGRRMVNDGHKLAVGGDSMIGWCIANQKARIALDVGKDPVRFNNPYLWRTRSELALPIIHGDIPLGAMTIQSDMPEAFDEDDIVVLQGVADNLATALQNAQLFGQVQNNLQEIQSMHRQYLARAWSEAHMGHPDGLTYSFEQTSLPEGQTVVEVPLLLRNETIGNLRLESDHTSLSSEEMKLVEAVATQAALALENARLLKESQKLAERERTAAHISGQVWSSPDIESILRTAIYELGRSFHVSEGLIQLKMQGTELEEKQSGRNGNHKGEE